MLVFADGRLVADSRGGLFTLRAGGGGEVCVTVASRAIVFPHWDASAISASVTDAVPSAADAPLPSRTISSSVQPSCRAASAVIFFRSSSAHSSTAFPVTYVVLEA